MTGEDFKKQNTIRETKCCNTEGQVRKRLYYRLKGFSRN